MSSKVLTPSELRPIIGLRKSRGERIVFTNGCFDLLHVGHTRFLEQAKALGDCLIVGVNSDASVRGIKADRPIVPHAQRAEVLAALASVDHVVIFDDLDPHALIKNIQPDVLVKGGDWPVDQIIGRDIVEASGGRVLNLPLVPDVSTTTIVERIRGTR